MVIVAILLDARKAITLIMFTVGDIRVIGMRRRLGITMFTKGIDHAATGIQTAAD